jgi:mono/diheme cytochrome c family protein
MSGSSSRQRILSGIAVVVALMALAALMTACAAPSGAGSASGQAAPQAAAPTAASAAQAAPAATEAPAAASAPAAAGGVSYSKDVMPIFQQSCIKCHGGSEGTKGDLSLNTYDDMMKGGQDGPVIVPGDAAGSLLVKQIQNGKMPKRASKLPQEQIDLVAKWVAEGAKNN